MDRLGGFIPAAGTLEPGQRALIWIGIGLVQFLFLVLLLIDPLWALALVLALAVAVVSLRYPFALVVGVMAARLAANRSMSWQLGPMFVGPFEPLFLLGLTLALIRSVNDRRSRLQDFPAAKLLLALVIWVGLSLTWSGDKGNGIVTFIRIAYEVVLVWLLASEIRTPKRFHQAIWTWLIVAGLLGIAGVIVGTQGGTEEIYGDVAFKSMSAGGRFGGLGQHPNWFGMSMAFGINPAFAMAYVERRRWKRWVLVAIAMVLLVAAISTGSRGAVWGTGMGSLFLALNNERLRRFLYRYWFVIAITFAVALLFGAGALTSAFFRVATRGIDTFWQGNTRFANWDACYRMCVETYGLGVGAGSYLQALPRFNERLLLSDSAYPHGIMWDVMAHYGFVGLSLMTAVILTVFKDFRSALAAVRGTVVEFWLIGMAAALVGYGAHSLVEFHLIDKPFWAFLGVSLGLVLAAKRMAKDPELMKKYKIEAKVIRARGSGIPVRDPHHLPPGA